MPMKYRKDQLKNTKEIDPKHKTSDTNLPCHSLHSSPLTYNPSLGLYTKMLPSFQRHN